MENRTVLTINEILKKHMKLKCPSKFLAHIVFNTPYGNKVEVAFNQKRQLTKRIGSGRWKTERLVLKEEVDPYDALLKLKSSFMSWAETNKF